MSGSRIARIVVALASVVALPVRSAAQQETQPVVYGAYYHCAPDQLARMDSVLRSFWAPLADKQVAAGNATTWGWLSHHTGGVWNRAFYFISADGDKAFDAVDALNGEAVRTNAALVRETARICSTHEDYVWSRVSGSQPVAELAQNRPASGYSIYYVCSPAREARADSIVMNSFAPTLNGQVQSGGMHSWTWLAHVIGGKYRRLLATDGASPKALANSMGNVVTELQAKQPAAFREFSEICDSHRDYIWNITGPQ